MEFVASLTAPLYWVIREDGAEPVVRNGTAFFLDVGQGPFGVTANHVIEGYEQARDQGNVVACQIGQDLRFDIQGSHRILCRHPDIDIATFQISADEIRSMGRTVFTGQQSIWPPPPPERDRGVLFAGIPGVHTSWLSSNEISFGVAPGIGIATSVGDRDISFQIKRQHLVDAMGNGVPPENFDFGGMSGGPMLTIVEHNGLRSYRLAGVIYQGPNPSCDATEAISGLEIVRARRADFILTDGRLDIARWSDLNMSRVCK